MELPVTFLVGHKVGDPSVAEGIMLRHLRRRTRSSSEKFNCIGSIESKMESNASEERRNLND
jgi:hypothetical protein